MIRCVLGIDSEAGESYRFGVSMRVVYLVSL